jgi:hypothetical protein
MSDPLDSAALDVASDANYDVVGDAYDSTPVKVTAASGVITQGWRPKRQFAAQYWNYILNAIGACVRSLRTHVIALEAAPSPPVEFTSSGTWTAGVNDYRIYIEMCGGGGGGAGGNWGDSAPTKYAVSGAGGGGAPLITGVLEVTPGVTYTITIGTGGGGGAAGTYATPTAPTDGSNGVSTTFKQGASTLLSGRGGSKGHASITHNSVATADGYIAVSGGTSIPGPVTNFQGYQTSPTAMYGFSPGCGGDGVGANSEPEATIGTGRAGHWSTTLHVAGDGGNNGADSSSYRGGAGGGGGGGGAFGLGTNGGNGGAAGSGGGGASGLVSDGGAAPANGGGGGGGGGAGGAGSTIGGDGGPGSAGGSGFLRLTPIYGGRT